MEVSFVRSQGKPDRVYVRRTSGDEVSWSFPTFGGDLPHDLVHLVVEATFDVGQGFWRRVDDGVDVARINAQANRVGGPDKYAGFGDDLHDLYLAEALAAIPWSIPEFSDHDRLSIVQESCAKQRIAMPPAVTVATIAATRVTLDQLRTRWRRLSPAGTLRLGFDPALPARGFVELGAAPPPG